LRVFDYPKLHLSHLKQRMRQSGDYHGAKLLDEHSFRAMVHEAIGQLDVDHAREEVTPFVVDPRALVDEIELA
jgi:hypothetical protein